MDINIAANKYLNMQKQRNLFLILSVILAVSNILIVLKHFLQEEKIVMIPGLEQELAVSNHKVSNSYLERTTHSFINILLNITSEDIQYKRKLILKYASHGSIKQINEYFANAEAEYKKFDLSTHFTVKKIDIKPGTLNVIAHGILASRFGKRGADIQDVSYSLTFDYIDGALLLKSFSKVLTVEEQKQLEKTKLLQQAEPIEQDKQAIGELKNAE